jgi:pimeloyl-ACP methyl ester carboxylesterase
MGVSSSYWAPQLRLLAGAYDVTAIDLPGHGRLSRERFTLDAAVEEVRKAVDLKPGGKPVVVGHSLGGYVSMAFVDRYPERVGALILSDCSRDTTGTSAAPYLAFSLLLSTSSHALMRRLAAAILRTRYVPAIAQPIVRAGLFIRGGIQGLNGIVGVNFRKALAKYDGPVLLINGERDFLFRPGEAEFLAASGNAWLYVIGGAGHLSNLDRPEEYTQAVRRFVDCHCGPAES